MTLSKEQLLLNEAKVKESIKAAISYGKKGFFDKTIEVCTQANKIHIENGSLKAELYFYHGFALQKKGSFTDAISSFQNSTWDTDPRRVA